MNREEIEQAKDHINTLEVDAYLEIEDADLYCRKCYEKLHRKKTTYTKKRIYYTRYITEELDTNPIHYGL